MSEACLHRYFLLWACLIWMENLIPLIQSSGGNYTFYFYLIMENPSQQFEMELPFPNAIPVLIVYMYKIYVRSQQWHFCIGRF